MFLNCVYGLPKTSLFHGSSFVLKALSFLMKEYPLSRSVKRVPSILQHAESRRMLQSAVSKIEGEGKQSIASPLASHYFPIHFLEMKLVNKCMAAILTSDHVKIPFLEQRSTRGGSLISQLNFLMMKKLLFHPSFCDKRWVLWRYTYLLLFWEFGLRKVGNFF